MEHMTATRNIGIDPEVYARRWRILAVLCLSLTIIMIANGSLNVALPTLAHDLRASTSSLQWMVDTYALVFAGLLFTAGTIGDRFGRKRALQAGLMLFLVGAAVATTASSTSTLIVARAIMGVAAAFVMPSTLSILANVFPAEERARAISIWAGVAAGGAALGPTVSGFLLEHFWWGSVFLVNVPLIVLAIVFGRRLVPSSKDPDDHPLDLPGALLSILGIGLLVYAIIEAPGNGWASPRTALTFAAAAVALVLFGLREVTAENPMLDLRLFRDRRFSVASAGIALSFFAMFGMFFLISQYLQLVLGYTPLEAGLVTLPQPVVMMLMSPQAPKLVARYGVARSAPAGLIVTGLGMAGLATVGIDSSLWNVYLAIIPLAVGMAITMTPLTTLIMSSVPLGRAGVGSAMNDTTRELGGALGVAVLGSVATSQFTSSLGRHSAEITGKAPTGLADALERAKTLPTATGDTLAALARSSFVDGLHLAALVGGLVLGGTALAARFLLPQPVIVHAQARNAEANAVA